MKIKTYFEALQISEALKKLNLDITQMDPQTRIKIKDRVVMFEPESDCGVNFIAMSEPIGNSEQLEYQSLDLFHKLLEGDEYSSDGGETWKEIGYYALCQ